MKQILLCLLLSTSGSYGARTFSIPLGMSPGLQNDTSETGQVRCVISNVSNIEQPVVATPKYPPGGTQLPPFFDGYNSTSGSAKAFTLAAAGGTNQSHYALAYSNKTVTGFGRPVPESLQIVVNADQGAITATCMFIYEDTNGVSFATVPVNGGRPF